MIPVHHHPAPLPFEEWLPLRGRWLRLLLHGIPVALAVGGLMVLLSPRYCGGGCGKKGRHGAAKGQIGAFKTAVELYRRDHGGECPRRLRDLIVRPAAEAEATRWNGPYLQDVTSVPADPWGNPYFYRVPGPGGADYEILSLGEDGRLGGTEDAEDVSNILK